MPEKNKDRAEAEDNKEQIDSEAASGVKEQNDRRAGGDEVPASYQDYDVSFPEEGMETDPEVDKRLFEAGFTNAQAQLLYDLAREKMLPLAEQVAGRLNTDKELEQLIRHYGGEGRWQTVSKQIEAWGKRNLPKSLYEALCCNAQGVLAMDKLMSAQEPKTLPKGGGQTEGLDEGGLKKLIASPAYWRDRDPEVVKQVEEGFERLQK